MRWRTSVSEFRDNELYIRGNALSELIDKYTFSEVVFLLLGGRLPNKAEARMFDSILVSMADHTAAVPSGFVPRVVASTGNTMNAAIAAGALAVGDYHGGAIEKAMEAMQSDTPPGDYVSERLRRKERIAGYGHKLLKKEDPRTTALFNKARELGLSDRYIKRARDIEHELQQQSGKVLPLNVDGAAAAVLSEFGFDSRLGKAMFVLGRMPGMIAHAHEELMNEKPFRRFDDEDVEYVGE